MKDIFISYAREEEKDYAIPLAMALSDLDFFLWIDIKELFAGKNFQEDIDKGIEESKYCIALLSEKYFSKNTTLSELDIFVEKQKEIIPIRCGFINPYLIDEKYSFLKNLLWIDWKDGIENVIEKIIRKIRPDLLPEFVYNDIRLKNIPIPQNQLHAAAFIQTYKSAGRMNEASQIALEYLSYFPNDPNIIILYFNIAKNTEDKYTVEIAFFKVFDYLKNNPNNISVRENFISYLTQLKTKNTFRLIIIDDTSAWLENHHNINIKKDYLTIVEKGNPIQIKRAIEEGKKWLIEEEDIQIRCALFRLVVGKGSRIEKESMLKETVDRIISDRGDNLDKLLTEYIKYISDSGNNIQKKDAIEICENWSRKHPKDNFVLPPYLSLIERLKDKNSIDRAFNFIQEWLSFPFEDISISINVREKFIKCIGKFGNPEQVEEVIKENRLWLKGIINVKSQHNVRAGLINLIKNRGTDNQVLEEINYTLEWLNYHQNETYVRSNFLNLAKERCKENSIIHEFRLYGYSATD
ncbi:MAG: toll/interleukin-1 receptor domain-containing protein [ANME-2 cluster archaeon]|nr:toll/interleukin-1 receptor domain-containing protein [ANME-2 cluster archaeon]